MMYKKCNYLIKTSIYSFVIIVFDQLLKQWMVHYHPSLVSRNRAIVFGLIGNQIIVYLLLLMGLIALIWLMISNESSLRQRLQGILNYKDSSLRSRSNPTSPRLRGVTTSAFIPAAKTTGYSAKGDKKIIATHQLSVSLIFAGVLSNIFDRVFNGGVVDYIGFGWWPNFNLADVFIIVGILFYYYQVFRQK